MRRISTVLTASGLHSTRFVTSLPTLCKPKDAPATLPDLPFPLDRGIPPLYSPKQLALHYSKHHKAYVDKLNALSGDKFDGMLIEEIVKQVANKPDQHALYNQAGQHFNHTFFWSCLTPNGTPMPEPLKIALTHHFGSVEDFKKAFEASGVSNFGSGWTWLVANSRKDLEIVNTSNAGCPVDQGLIPLLTADVWEHAYYVDYENRRPDFLIQFWKAVNWNFVAEQLAKVK